MILSIQTLPLFNLGNYEPIVIDIAFYLFRVFLIILFSVTLFREAFAWLRIDQIVYTYWIPLTLAGLIGLILVMWDSVIMNLFI